MLKIFANKKTLTGPCYAFGNSTMACPGNFVMVIIIAVLTGSRASLHEDRLLDKLFKFYNSAARPALANNDTVNVTFGLSLNQLINVHEKSQIMVLSVFIRQMWHNPILSWDPEDYNGIDEINVNPKRIWRPDIVLYNNADEDKNFGGNLDRLNTRVILKYTGETSWLAPIILKSKCDIDVKYFPFDTQHCILKFGSWTYDKSRLDLHSISPTADRDIYSENSEWKLISAKCKRKEKPYVCCPGKLFPDITFTIAIARRSLFYVINLIFPMVMISMLEILSFLLPAESGERISLAITLLLAMTVFMLVVAEIIPATSEVVPLVGIYFIASMAEMVIMIIALCYIMRLYHIGPNDPPMSAWTRYIVLDWLSYVVRIRARTSTNPPVDVQTPMLNNHSNLHFKNEQISNGTIGKMKLNGTVPLPPPWQDHKHPSNHIHSNHNSHSNHNHNNHNHSNLNRSNHSNLKYNDIKSDNHVSKGEEQKLEGTDQIVKKLDVLVDYLRSMEEEDAIRAEWRIVAMTIDRCLLVFFTVVFFLTVFGCFSYAPGYVS